MTRVEKWKIVEKLKREDIQLTGCETLDEDGRKGVKNQEKKRLRMDQQSEGSIQMIKFGINVENIRRNMGES